MKEVYISQGSAVKHFRLGGQLHNHECQISSGCCQPRTVKIGSFEVIYSIKIQRGSLFELVFETVYIQTSASLDHSLCIVGHDKTILRYS